MSLSSSNNNFTITWKVQNYSMFVMEDEEFLDSPNIVAEGLDKTEWVLQIYPKGNTDGNLSCYLTRNETKHSPDSIKIDCSMTLLSVDNLSNITKTKSCCTFEENDFKEFVFGNVDEIVAKKDVLLPSDILTIQCCMWRTHCDVDNPGTAEKEAVDVEKDSKTAGSDKKKLIPDQIVINKNNLINHVYVGNADSLDSILSEKMYLSAKKNLEDLKKHLFPNTCTIRTVTLRELRCMIWEIIKFDEIQLHDRIFTSVISTLNAPSFVLALYLSKDVDGNDHVQIDIHRNQNDDIRCFVKCKITILNALYEDQVCIQDTHLFDDNSDIWRIPLIKKSQLYKDKCLKKGSLLLRCEFVISQGSFHTLEATVSFPSMQSIANINDWKTGLPRKFKNGDFSDIVLQCGQQSFDAHRAILSDKSPFFRDLFESDSEEPKVDVTDCEPETLDRFLDFMYSGVLEEMPLEQTMKLFTAAKTYKVESLARLCSCVLRSALDASNVCDVLLSADSHQDELLKTAAIKFISAYPEEVFHSTRQGCRDEESLTADALQDIHIGDQDFLENGRGFNIIITCLKFSNYI